MKRSLLNGAWEERGVIGTRIEINNKRIVIMWRNSPVLDTSFEISEKNGSAVLELEKTGLRYQGSASDYAEVTGIEYADGKLIFKENFPITGPSETALEKTENSKYGPYLISDGETLKLLSGEWKDGSGFYTLKIKKNVMEWNGTKIKFHTLIPKSGFCGIFRIVDEDPSKYEVFHLSNMTFDGQNIRANEIVCDGPTIELVFTKQ